MQMSTWCMSHGTADTRTHKPDWLEHKNTQTLLESLWYFHARQVEALCNLFAITACSSAHGLGADGDHRDF